MKLWRSVDEHILKVQLWQLSCSVLNGVFAPYGTCSQSQKTQMSVDLLTESVFLWYQKKKNPGICLKICLKSVSV